MRTDDGQTGLEGNRHGLRYQAGVTEHMNRADRQAGDGTPRATEGECGYDISTGD